MKAKALAIFAIMSLCLSLLAVVAPPKASSVLAAILIPHAFYGDVTIGGEAALLDTLVSAKTYSYVYDEEKETWEWKWVESGSVTTWEEGRYGWGLGVPEEGKDNLLVQGEYISSGDEIEFYINGVKADQLSTFQSGVWTELDLTVASAPPTPNQVEYWAVIAGVSDYPGTGSDLSFAAKDARDVRNALLTSDIWSSDHITLLIDGDATAAAIEDAINAVGTVADGNDLFFFFFCGHGGNQYDIPPLDEVDGLDEYLCPYDFSPNRIVDDELGQWLGDLPMTKVAVAIDSCFSGGMIRGESDEVLARSVAYEGTPHVGDGFARDLNDVLQGVVLTASAEDELSGEHPLLANGIFTNYFTGGLWHGAADADGNTQISMEEAYNYLYQPVVDFSALFSVGQHTQHPQMFDNYPGELKLMGPRMPDLAISAVDPDPLYTSMGVEIELGVTIENIGDGDAADFGFLVDVYKDLNTAPGAIEIGEYRQYVDYLGSGESETLWFTVSYDDVGEYQLWAQVNTGHWLAESNEDNNAYGPVPVTVFRPEPNPHIWADNRYVDVGEVVTFENWTTGGTHPYTKAEWDFEADGIIDLTLTGTEADVMADVTHVYDSPGVYTVRLWMTDSWPWTMYEERPNYIEVFPCGTNLHFVADKTDVDVGELVTFETLSNSCAHPFIKAEWDFEADGIIDLTLTGTEAQVTADVTWSYDSPGVYTVRLWMTDSTPTTRYEERPNYITVGDGGVPPLTLEMAVGIAQDATSFNLVHYPGDTVSLPTGTEPDCLVAVYYYDPVALELLYYFPGWPSTLTKLEHRKVYLVIVSDATVADPCKWEIPLP